jgi:hypothetical protein
MFPVILAALAFAPMLLGSPYSVTLGQTLARHREGSLKSLSYPPEDEPGPEPLPAWVKRYQKAKSRGLIPSIRPAVLINGLPEYPFYSDSTVSNPRKVCSWTVSKCNSRREWVFPRYLPVAFGIVTPIFLIIFRSIVNAPRGAMGISFDDGPQPPTAQLLSFLKENEQKATHFMIGSRIHQNPSLLVETVKKNHDHIAVHTWSRESLPFTSIFVDIK